MYSLSSFKTYDIRGVWQIEIDEKFWRILGYALGIHLIEKYTSPKILIGSDVREANLVLIDEFLRGLKYAGIDEVTLIGKDDTMTSYIYGVCSTPMAYYAALDRFDCACLFTASHNPREYVGVKIVDNQCHCIKSENLRAFFEKEENTHIEDRGLPVITPYSDTKILTLLADIKTKFQTFNKIPKITVDYSHGAATHFEQLFLREVLGENCMHIFTNPDGTFPAHETDTSRFANYQPLLAEIQKNGSDFWFIFDGDGDRFGIIVPDGTVVTGDIILSIIARELLIDGTAEKLWSNIIFQEVFCGKIVSDTVKKYNWELRMTCVGREAFVREVTAANALLAGEVSTHLLFKEYGMIEMPLAGLYYFLKAREKYSNATELVREFDTYARGQVLQFITDKKDEAIEKLKIQYDSFTQITIDGIRIEAPEWWFCVRKSWTEPMLKVAIEWKNRAIYDEVLRELRDFFQDFWAKEKI